MSPKLLAGPTHVGMNPRVQTTYRLKIPHPRGSIQRALNPATPNPGTNIRQFRKPTEMSPKVFSGLVVDNTLKEVCRCVSNPKIRMEEAEADVEEPSIGLGRYSQKLADLVVRADTGGESEVDRATIVVAELEAAKTIVLMRKVEGVDRPSLKEDNEVLDE